MLFTFTKICSSYHTVVGIPIGIYCKVHSKQTDEKTACAVNTNIANKHRPMTNKSRCRTETPKPETEKKILNRRIGVTGVQYGRTHAQHTYFIFYRFEWVIVHQQIQDSVRIIRTNSIIKLLTSEKHRRLVVNWCRGVRWEMRNWVAKGVRITDLLLILKTTRKYRWW